MPPTSLRLLLADDHAILRTGLRRLLSEMPEVTHIGEASHGQGVLDLVRSDPWDVIVLDLDMPGLSPLDVLKRIKADHPDIAVLILREVVITKIPVIISSSCTKGDTAYEDEHLGTQRRIDGDSGFNWATG